MWRWECSEDEEVVIIKKNQEWDLLYELQYKQEWRTFGNIDRTLIEENHIAWTEVEEVILEIETEGERSRVNEYDFRARRHLDQGNSKTLHDEWWTWQDLPQVQVWQ